ncbi:MAG: SRPBCC family protein, partial [Myxococcota bacterium]
MKVLKVIGIALGAVAAVFVAFFAIAMFLPSEVHVERSLVINAQPETLYDFVDSYERFNEFSPWYERDPNMKQSLEGPDSGVGHTMKWESPKDDVGKGSQEIVEAVSPTVVKSQLDFGFGEPPTATWTFAKVDGGTKATWSLDSTFHSDYVGRFFGLKLDDWVGTDYERGLAKLKEVAEAEQKKKDAELAEAEAPAKP